MDWSALGRVLFTWKYLFFLLFALVLGYLSAYLGILFYETLDDFGLRQDAFTLAEQSRLELFLYAVLAIGPIEEFAKFVPFLLLFTIIGLLVAFFPV